MPAAWKTHVVPVVPTLRGLAEANKEEARAGCESRLFPWSSVAPVNSSQYRSWVVYDEAGERVRDERGRLTLIARSWHLHEVACRAQHRSFRRAFERGDFSITESYKQDRWCGWLMILFGLPISGMLLVPVVQGLLWAVRDGTFPLLPGEDRALLIVVAVLSVVNAILWFGFMFYIGQTYLKKPDVSAARFDSEGVRLELGSGLEITATWSDTAALDLRQAFYRLKMKDGSEYWIYSADRHRTRRVLAFIGDHLGIIVKPYASDFHLWCRLVLWFVLGGLAAAGLMYWFGEPGESIEQFALFVFGGLFLASAGLIYPGITYLSALHHRRSRRNRRLRCLCT
jgi:hypothetical protein